MSDKAAAVAKARVEELERLLRDITTLLDVTQATYAEAKRRLDVIEATNAADSAVGQNVIRNSEPPVET